MVKSEIPACRSLTPAAIPPMPGADHDDPRSPGGTEQLLDGRPGERPHSKVTTPRRFTPSSMSR